MTDEGVTFYHCPECFSTMSNPLKEDFMAKEEPEVQKPTVWESKAVVCQCCQFHSNNPSTCNSTGEKVGRKTKGCDTFKRKK